MSRRNSSAPLSDHMMQYDAHIISITYHLSHTYTAYLTYIFYYNIHPLYAVYRATKRDFIDRNSMVLIAWTINLRCYHLIPTLTVAESVSLWAGYIFFGHQVQSNLHPLVERMQSTRRSMCGRSSSARLHIVWSCDPRFTEREPILKPLAEPVDFRFKQPDAKSRL